jgi:hypothetical protein
MISRLRFRAWASKVERWESSAVRIAKRDGETSSRQNDAAASYGLSWRAQAVASPCFSASRKRRFERGAPQPHFDP